MKQQQRKIPLHESRMPDAHSPCHYVPFDPPQKEDRRKRDVTCSFVACVSFKEQVLGLQEGGEQRCRREKALRHCVLGGAGPGGPRFRVNKSQTSAGGIGEGSTELPRRLGGGNGSLDTGQGSPWQATQRGNGMRKRTTVGKSTEAKSRVCSPRVSTSGQRARKEVGAESGLWMPFSVGLALFLSWARDFAALWPGRFVVMAEFPLIRTSCLHLPSSKEQLFFHQGNMWSWENWKNRNLKKEIKRHESQNPDVKHILNYIVPVFKNQIFVVLYIVSCLFCLEMYCDVFLIFKCSHIVPEFRCLLPYSVNIWVFIILIFFHCCSIRLKQFSSLLTMLEWTNFYLPQLLYFLLILISA